MGRLLVASAVALALAACTHRDPPGWDAAPESLSAVPLSAPLPSSLDAAVDAPDPATLPQTRERPDASGVAFSARTTALWAAIVKDDPTLAIPFFFPLEAYKQVKAIASPESDWNHRLVANYARDIHRLHAQLGSAAPEARLVEVRVPEERSRWVEPGEEYNKIGYYRVFGAKIAYEAAGRQAAFDVSSLISWRGEWFVVHLGGFK